MTQVGFKTITNLRDDHFNANPVTSAVEQFILLEKSHYSTMHGKDQWLPSSGGSFAAQAIWFATVTSYNNVAPDGSNTAVLIASTAVSAYHGIRAGGLSGNGNWQGFLGEVAGGQWAFADFVKAGTTTVIDIELVDSAGATVTYRFDLATGTRTSGQDNKVRIAPAVPGSPAYAGWYRIYSVGLVLSASAEVRHYIKMVKAGSNSFLGTTNENFYFAGSYTEYNQAVCCYAPWNTPNTNIYWGQSAGQDLLIIPLPSTVSAPQAMTVYMEWLDRGNSIMAGAALNATTPGIFRIGGVANTAANSLNVTQTATGFSGTYNNAGSTSVSTVSLSPDVGDLIALRAVLDATGSLTLYASKNGAAETAGTTGAARGFPSAWDAAEITPNSLGGTNAGDMELRRLHIAAGDVAAAVLAAL